ncbi:hypothetical protein BDP27DRAFT_1374900 [Rhodocollybia butyracea]|uniref:Uncharacterized protein n=1 Tax=Rhodocollybia butyracea TaxID=206335 RepID=A0A9P5TVS1_9AGAR|nr:hypothetical protein BDP27DRAFT_1374900 [Rhodocollybia butyracea]
MYSKPQTLRGHAITEPNFDSTPPSWQLELILSTECSNFASVHGLTSLSCTDNVQLSIFLSTDYETRCFTSLKGQTQILESNQPLPGLHVDRELSPEHTYISRSFAAIGKGHLAIFQKPS